MNSFLRRQAYYGSYTGFEDLEATGQADQMPAADFNKDGFGFPQSDIIQLMNASSEAEFVAIASRLQEIHTDEQFKDLSVEDLIKRVKPRLCQDPVELMRYVEYLDAYVLENSQPDPQPDPQSDPQPDPQPAGNSSE